MINHMCDDYVLMIHFRNPYIFMAGSENYISEQIKDLKERKIDTLVIFPIVKKKKGMEIAAWGLVYNKKFVKALSVAELCKVIDRINGQRQCKGIFIHSFLKANMADMKQICSFSDKVVVYLHDYCTCCIQYNLRKNGDAFCGDAVLSDHKCGDCIYYEESLKRKREIQIFLENVEDLIVVAPSEYTQKIWKAAYPSLAGKVRVIGHKLMRGNYIENSAEIGEEEKVKIAFVGNGTTSKGWDKWINAIDRLQTNPNYIFYHFGDAPEERSYINHVPVSIKDNGANAMIDALRKFQIHAVVLFSCVPETYSYTYVESMAANQYIITSVNSGNIQDQISVRKNGIVLEDSSEALYMYLCKNEDVKAAINTYRKSTQIAPLELINNKDYLVLLDNGGQIRHIKYTESFKGRIDALLINILYRIRYMRH